MTTTAIPALIAEAREHARKASLGTRDVLSRLADALEAEHKRASITWEDADAASRADYRTQLRVGVARYAKAEAERDHYRAAIDAALAVSVRIPELPPHRAWPQYQDDVQAILSRALNGKETE